MAGMIPAPTATVYKRHWPALRFAATTMRQFFFLIPLLLFAGCQSTPVATLRHDGEGDPGAFIVRIAEAFGDREPLTRDLPFVKSAWQYEVGEHEVIVHLPATKFASVQDLLQTAFGPPTIKPTKNTDGGEISVYRRTDKGGGILLTHDGEVMQVGILAPISDEESWVILNRIFAEMAREQPVLAP